MVPMPNRLGIAVVAVLLAAPAFASELSLTIREGKVTLLAQDVSVREVLAEWARVGRVTIVNGERLPGPPLTLQLDNVPEGEALAAVLRSASGYVLAPRAHHDANASRFDRVLILPVSVPPPAVDPPANPAGTPASRLPAFPRPVQAQPQVDDVPGGEAENEAPADTPAGLFNPQPTDVPAQVAPPGSAGSPLYAPVPGQVVQPAPEARPGVPRVRLPGQQPQG